MFAATSWQEVFIAFNSTAVMFITLVAVPFTVWFINRSKQIKETGEQNAKTSESLKKQIGELDSKTNDLGAKADSAATVASDAIKATEDLTVAINGRVEDLVKAARAEGFADGRCKGIAEVAKAMGGNPKIPIEAHEVLKAVADASSMTLQKPV